MFPSRTGVAVTGDTARTEEQDALRSHARRGVEFEGRTIWPAGRLHRGWLRRALTGFNFQRGTTFVD